MSADEHPTQPLPDPSARWVLQTDAPASAPRRTRRWPWLVAVLVVVVLAVAAWFAGEYIARGIVERTIREQITQNLDIPVDHPIDIQIPGPILPQLIVGSIGDLTISSEDVPLDGVTADISVNAQDVNIHGGDWSGGYATVSLDETQLRALLAGIDGFPAESVSIDAPDVRAEFTLQLFGFDVPIGVALTPSAAGGDIELTPASLRLGDSEVSAQSLRDQFGSVADAALRTWDICIADRLPRAVELTGVEVNRDRVVADFEISSAIVNDPEAQQKGSCAD
ncbi:LmeA family phospholipid-binding protein [Microbacterium lacticum]|uniref:DUF2993 family protein n=1 Tax=Microbacterium lacticum TaxID=33885 RepID=A0A4Y3UQF6_9MICO|nr:DUF2993 domain-containing protein [Microbacterium lacticum]TQM95082.1 DUF2993 family protein [Microbacterium lacticum]GEB95987.1 hypothetical protein MLA01_22060 [Microbacterium lacticum]GGI67527.1 hypothetical protein GCM10009724_18370 [Microbacterium lacticum]